MIDSKVATRSVIVGGSEKSMRAPRRKLPREYVNMAVEPAHSTERSPAFSTRLSLTSKRSAKSQSKCTSISQYAGSSP